MLFLEFNTPKNGYNITFSEHYFLTHPTSNAVVVLVRTQHKFSQKITPKHGRPMEVLL
jgi:hypothetical protein